MKDFDADRRKREDVDRQFMIGGETFTRRVAVAPEELMEWSAMVGGEYVLKDENDKPVLGPDVPARDGEGRLLVAGGQIVKVEGTDPPELVLRGGTLRMLPGRPISTLTEARALEIYENTIRAFLEPDDHPKWGKVRQRDAAHPLTLADLEGLVDWLFEEHSGRPTGPSSGSTASTPGGGNGQPATGSTGGSQPLAAVS